MPRFRVEMLLTEIHAYTIEAADAEAAIDKIYEEDPSPDFIAAQSWEVESFDEMKSDKDYYDGRREFVEGIEKQFLTRWLNIRIIMFQKEKNQYRCLIAKLHCNVLNRNERLTRVQCGLNIAGMLVLPTSIGAV